MNTDGEGFHFYLPGFLLLQIETTWSHSIYASQMVSPPPPRTNSSISLKMWHCKVYPLPPKIPLKYACDKSDFYMGMLTWWVRIGCSSQPIMPLYSGKSSAMTPCNACNSPQGFLYSLKELNYFIFILPWSPTGAQKQLKTFSSPFFIFITTLWSRLSRGKVTGPKSPSKLIYRKGIWT